MYEGRPLAAWKADSQSSDPKIRFKAAEVLMNFLKQGGIPGLVEAMNDRDPIIRATANAALIGEGPEARAAIPGLVALLRDKKSRDRGQVAMLLGTMGPDAVPVLTETLADKDPQLRSAAAYGLCCLQRGEAKAAVPALTGLLQDEGQVVRDAAAKALWHIGPEARSAVPALIAALKDEKNRENAARALGGIGPDAKAAVPALVELLSKKDADANLLEEVAWALGHIGPDARAATKALTELARDANPRVRKAAATSLDRIKGKP
jgi:HEAT repeat protein